ncbi:amino acid ABC transporter permease [Roseateles amylovorans]|uniref:Amino acid ABC transporter permease n=1 Tax=Roseateles amylovorans TaxID=2978473 RepID=A0ABY6B0Q4_9BURK|nr:amino acid ABC transporter permease [Roseateles amylovorans]UXH78420.1 amino acid ABC transporter permease [Roseateles amylovorans]
MPLLDFSPLLHGQFLDWLLAGVRLSLLLTLFALCLALPLGTLIALARLAPFAPLRAVAWGYVEAVRNVPLLAHMLFWYFAVPELLPDGLKAWLYAGHIEAVAALAALVTYTAAYMAEDVRSGLRSVPQGQWLAARALGLRHRDAMRWIVLPQALRATVPPLISQTLNLWKNTSIATVVGAAELMYQAQRVETASFRGFETFALATATYLGVSLLITAAGVLYQRRYPARPAAR